jgi:Xaa-Pro aminopeptidase
VTGSILLQSGGTGDETGTSAPDRRADIDAKAGLVTALLKEVNCDGLILLEPANVSWMTSGVTPRGVPDYDSLPGIYCNAEARWILCSNADTQRLFDEELDGLGFQLKEWPWHWTREQILTDFIQSRRVACDRPLEGTTLVADQIRKYRFVLSPYERACHRALGELIAHSLEATCRTFDTGESEREIAGQVSHRLIHRGVQPLAIGVAADGRSRVYRRFGYTSVPVKKYAVMTATARKYGLTATASRTVSFGPPDDDLRTEHNTVCRVAASFLASTWPEAMPREILVAARRIYLVCQQEHEWLQTPQGHLTGRQAVELLFTPRTEHLFQSGMAVTWAASAGAAVSCDTFHITDQGPKTVTPTEGWPLKKIRIQGAELVRADVLQR